MIEPNWKKLEEGLNKYLKIMHDFEKVDVSKDDIFRKRFKGFYKVRRGKEFCDIYFSILESNKKNRELCFETVLKELLKLGRFEASFTSKLLATINPYLPVWDKEVLKHIEYELLPAPEESDRIKRIVQKYKSMIDYYKIKLCSIEGKRMIKSFNDNFPGVNITDIKKIDLILWQTRR